MRYAHSVADAPTSNWDPLEKHLSDAALLAGGFASKFGYAEWGRTAGLLHDIGKHSTEFQERLKGRSGKVDHATAGARIAAERYGLWGRLLAYVIAGHHAGLANWSGEMTAGDPSPLSRRLIPKSYPIPSIAGWERHCPSLPAHLTPFSHTLEKELLQSIAFDRQGPSLALFIRMLFSTLVDADRLATEAFYRSAEGRPPAPRGEWPDLVKLKERIDAHMAELTSRGVAPALGGGERRVAEARARVLGAAREAAGQPCGLFSLTVPTGGGKTLASLTFALDHAVAHGLQRIIYVIPFTSIIEQTARVFCDALGQDFERCILEHHSAFREDEALARLEREAGGESALQAGERLRFATENWDAPIVVTTAVQFFESLFSNRPGRCRKLHNIAKSVVILDEAQMLPLPLLRPTVAVIEELAGRYGTSVVLCTATQPAITRAGRSGKGGLAGGLKAVREIVDDPDTLYGELARVTVATCRTMTPETLAEALGELEKVLCIVGTRAQARDLFKLLQDRADGVPTFHLSALMCAAHRTRRLYEIRAALAAGGCRTVATTVVEAGVDIDFPAVWRQMAGLDSLAQAAGRCNREGRMARELAVVQPFEVDGWGSIRELRSNEAAARETLRHLIEGQDPLGPDAIASYFDYLYAMKTAGQRDGLDADGIMAALNTAHLEGCLPFADVARMYRLIDSVMEPVIVPFDDDARKAIGELADPDLPSDRIGAVARKLQPYIVNVPRDAFHALSTAGRIEAINGHRFDEQFMRLRAEAVEALYSNDFGLDWSDATFRKAEQNLM